MNLMNIKPFLKIYFILGLLCINCTTSLKNNVASQQDRQNFCAVEAMNDKHLNPIKEKIYLGNRIFPTIQGKTIKTYESVEGFLMKYKNYLNIEKGYHLSVILDKNISLWKRRIPVHIQNDISMSILDQISQITKQVKLNYKIYKKIKYYKNIKKEIIHLKIIIYDKMDEERFELFASKKITSIGGDSLEFIGIIPKGRKVFPVGMYILIQIKYNLTTANYCKILIYGEDGEGNKVTAPLCYYAGNILRKNTVNNYNMTCYRETVVKNMGIEMIKINEKGDEVGKMEIKKTINIKFQESPTSKETVWQVKL